MFQVGQTAAWHRNSPDMRSVDVILVKVVKIARNGIIVEMADGTRKRVARDRLRPPKPAPAKPFLRRPTQPTEDSQPMLGQPAGWIPPVLPKPWLPMRIASDPERVVHAVIDQRALCGLELAPASIGWLWVRGDDVSCEECWQKHLEAELERDPIVQALRSYGHTGPITREDYISFNWAGCSVKPWTAEHEAELPVLLQDWKRFERNARRRQKYAEQKYGQWARDLVDELVQRLIAK
jgi:hypothetical protein